MTKPRVLVVDDSAFARAVLSKLLRATDAIEVVGTARDGNDALAKIAELDPDLITLDLTMPELDGLGVLRALAGKKRPRVIVVSISSVETQLGLEALLLGAIEIIAKPTALANDRLAEVGERLIATILAITAGNDVLRPAFPTPPIGPAVRARPRAELVMIGASTGGPQALTRVITGLPANLAAPVAMVLHIPAAYTEGLAMRLDAASALHVVEAREGLVLEPGMVVLARGGVHMRIVRNGGAFVAHLDRLPLRSFVPSVDELFASGAEAAGSGALGVVLTGMGDDGLVGARKIAAAGGSLLTESSATSIVYGMPRAVYEAGLGAESVRLESVADAIVNLV